MAFRHVEPEADPRDLSVKRPVGDGHEVAVEPGARGWLKDANMTADPNIGRQARQPHNH